MPGEEAIFIKSGTVEQVFDSGRYQLSTENYPFISRLRNAMTGGVSTFNSVVYFVRKADSEEILWGTQSPIQVRDKVWGVRTDAKVRGSYKIRITNPSKFLEKLIGNNVPYETQQEIRKYFSQEFQGKVKSVVSKFLNGLEQEMIGIDAYLEELSERLEPLMDEVLDSYGLKCVKFSLSAIDIDVSKYDKLDEAQISSVSKVKEAQGDLGVMNVLGERWGQQQAVNVMGDLARNPSGGIGTIGAGLGLGAAAGNAFAPMMSDAFSSLNGAQRPTEATSPVENEVTPSGRDEDPVETLTKLKKLLDAGLIEQSEFDRKKAEILDRM